MKNKYAWSRYSDDEVWHGGPCDTIKECVEEAYNEGYEMTDTFAIGHIEPYEINCDFAYTILNYLGEDAFEEVGEIADEWLSSVSKEDLENLNSRLTAVINDWLKEVNEEPTFYKVIPCEECTLKEALDVHDGLMSGSPKGGKI